MANELSFSKNAEFRRQAKDFAKWYRLQDRAVLEAGKIAAEWLKHYSRQRNANRLADALFNQTGVRITGRTLRNYRDAYKTAEMFRKRTRQTKSGNHFHISVATPTHLMVIARSKLSDEAKVKLIREIDRDKLTIPRTKARLSQIILEENRLAAVVPPRRDGPRVVRGDSINIVGKVSLGSIHHLLCDWQWDNTGMWREEMTAGPVHRPDDPVEHLCKFLRTARPRLNQNGIVWIFSKVTAFEDGEIGLPFKVQQTAFELGLRYCSEYIAPHRVAGYHNADSFLATAHTPIHPFVPQEFDLPQMDFAPTVGTARTSPNHVSQLNPAKERHPYEKPVGLFEDLIRLGVPGGFVFDGFSGSGASGVAAVRCGCSFLGAEMQSHYVRVANEAIASAVAENDSNSIAG
jgi:DNA methylase